ncbi:FdhF/YdeP family oxidoreductase [Thalassoroseus pseudoceratinae]|uniref:FdhF/YdeP family oxidoreductase n=1 Tax=Thalassoroseus pseudoceratinae TaxID=2713176 RepID=UPI001421D3D2|nr:FdhF/YdeP family oxidoreductase [Thalassoroseus pseudoceratinae]
MRAPKRGGGWKAIRYSLKLANRVGWRRMWDGIRSKNTCKTCAVGMGGQLGGMVNEGGHFPEVCKKSFQAMASDLQPAIARDFFETYSLPKLRSLSPRQLENSGRLTQPLILDGDRQNYRPIGWDEALDKIAEKLRASGPERSFFYASGRSSNEAGFLLQLMARLFGTNYVNNCSYYCHQASGVGLSSSIGTGAGTVRLEDLEHCDLYILMGANPASNHPRLMRSLMQLRRNGGKIVVINPLRELGLINFSVPSDVRSLLFGSKIATDYIQPHCGGDLALLTGIAKAVLERGAEDSEFLKNHTLQFEELRSHIEQISWDEIVAGSGVDREVIEKLTDQFLSAKNVVIGWAMGVTHHLHGTQTVQAIANLLLLRGMVGRRGAGVMPIRGHSNVQGMGSVGVTPTLKKAMLERFEDRLGITPPSSPGYDTMACMEAAGRSEIDAAFCLGGNLFGSNPDSQFAANAMEKIDQVVYLSTTLNTGHAWGVGRETIVLPVLPRDEEPQPTTQESMFSFVRYSDGGPTRYEGPRSEVSILCGIARRLLGADGGPVDWVDMESHAAVRKLMGELIPEYVAMGNVDETKQEFHVPGRAVEEYNFPTETGKAKFHAVPLPQNSLADGEFRLMSIRSEGQFNTVVYDEEDLYRGQERRDVILLNPADIERLGFGADQRVRVKSDTGEMRNIIVRPFDVRSGTAVMYYPESNVLVSRAVDPLSKTPAFKNVIVTVSAEDG